MSQIVVSCECFSGEMYAKDATADNDCQPQQTRPSLIMRLYTSAIESNQRYESNKSCCLQTEEYQGMNQSDSPARDASAKILPACLKNYVLRMLLRGLVGGLVCDASWPNGIFSHICAYCICHLELGTPADDYRIVPSSSILLFLLHKFVRPGMNQNQGCLLWAEEATVELYNASLVSKSWCS